MKLDTNHESLIYKNDNYEVFNVKPYDHLVDTLILACSEDESEQLLIPVDKAILVDNIPFFTAMFREDSNWIEGKVTSIDSGKNTETESIVDQESKSEKFESGSEHSTPNKIDWINDKISKSKRTDGNHYLTLKMTFPNKIKPLFFAKFLKSLYVKWMDISEANCIDYYRVVDYLQDQVTMNRIKNFINLNITFENSIDLMQLTNKFDQSIETLYSEKDVNGQEITTLIYFLEKVSTSDSATFIKIIQNLRKKTSSSACVDILKLYLKIQVIRSTSCKSDVSKIINQIKCLFTNCNSQDKFSIYNQCLDIISAKNEEVPVSIYKDIFTENLSSLGQCCYLT